jgi:D-aminoacyl-tRNA deacylase
MRAVIQRVTASSVAIGGAVKAAIGPGLLVLLAVEETDTVADVNNSCAV